MRFNDEDGEVHEVRVADASDGLRGEPAQRYSVHVQVREMWLHDEENVEAAADAMKRPLSTLRSARRGSSLQLRVGDANGGVGGHRWTPEHGGREDRLCLRAASGRSWHEAGDGLGGARGDHGAEEGVSRPDRRGTASRDALAPVAAPALKFAVREPPHGGAPAAPTRLDLVEDHHRYLLSIRSTATAGRKMLSPQE